VSEIKAVEGHPYKWLGTATINGRRISVVSFSGAYWLVAGGYYGNEEGKETA
jgi:hypothetical protein